MMPAASISNVTIARAAQLVGFAVVAVALAIVSWRGTSLNLPHVGQFAGIIGSGFLGGIINPLMRSLTGSDVGVVMADTAQAVQAAEAEQDRAADELGAKSDMVWEVAVFIGAAAIVVAALALAINGDKHMNAAPALTALTTAFGALFIDTTKVLHSPSPGPGASLNPGSSSSPSSSTGTSTGTGTGAGAPAGSDASTGAGSGAAAGQGA